MNRPPSATRYTSTANRRPLLIEIALIAFVIAAIFVAALVGMSAALAADAAERAIPGVNSSGSSSSHTEARTPPAFPVRT
jgi:divalent metal cation (Fe/Co/Zn/Cd) transporter